MNHKLSGRILRIGHLGWFNDLMTCGTLAGLAKALVLASVAHRKVGVDAAIASLPLRPQRRHRRRRRRSTRGAHNRDVPPNE